MAFNEELANKLRELLVDVKNIEEKFMFGGICFMVNDKMCMGVVKDELMCRIHPDKEEQALNQKGSRPMDFTGRPMRGYIFVNEVGLKSKRDFDYWIKLCLDFNKEAKSYKKKSK